MVCASSTLPSDMTIWARSSRRTPLAITTLSRSATTVNAAEMVAPAGCTSGLYGRPDDAGEQAAAPNAMLAASIRDAMLARMGGIIARGQEGAHERRRRAARSPGSRYAGIPAGAGRVRRLRRRRRGGDPRQRARRSAARRGAHDRALRSLPALPGHRALLPRARRRTRSRPHRAAQAQPRAMARGDGPGRPEPRVRLLPALDGDRPQPPGLWPGRPDPAAVHGGRHESDPDRARGDLPGRDGRSGTGAGGVDGVEQAAAAQSECAAGRLPASPTDAAPGACRPPERVLNGEVYFALWVSVMVIALAASSYLATEASCWPALCSASPSAASTLAL